MDKEKLKNTLHKLHADLENVEVDAELKSLLNVLDNDIASLLKQDVHDNATANSLAERAQAISAEFAARHPRIEPILRELGAILERIGI